MVGSWAGEGLVARFAARGLGTRLGMSRGWEPDHHQVALRKVP